MTERFAHLHDRPAPIRERGVTARRATHWIFAFTLAACGGGSSAKPHDTYAKGTEVQQACCEHLAGGPRDQCLQSIVRVDDKEVATTSVNQQTYDCVVSHFTCDPTTGRPTRDSAQAQLECIQDLQ